MRLAIIVVVMGALLTVAQCARADVLCETVDYGERIQQVFIGDRCPNGWWLIRVLAG